MGLQIIRLWRVVQADVDVGDHLRGVELGRLQLNAACFLSEDGLREYQAWLPRRAS
jgi:hypothetical protein